MCEIAITRVMRIRLSAINNSGGHVCAGDGRLGDAVGVDVGGEPVKDLSFRSKRNDARA